MRAPQAIKIFSKAALRLKKEWVKSGPRLVSLTALDKALKELAIMKKMHHPNVVRCYEIMDDASQDEMFMGARGCRGGCGELPAVR